MQTLGNEVQRETLYIESDRVELAGGFLKKIEIERGKIYEDERTVLQLYR